MLIIVLIESVRNSRNLKKHILVHFMIICSTYVTTKSLFNWKLINSSDKLSSLFNWSLSYEFRQWDYYFRQLFNFMYLYIDIVRPPDIVISRDIASKRGD